MDNAASRGSSEITVVISWWVSNGRLVLVQGLAAELGCLRDGLKLAKDLDYQCIRISVDSISVVNLIRDRTCM